MLKWFWVVIYTSNGTIGIIFLTVVFDCFFHAKLVNLIHFYVWKPAAKILFFSLQKKQLKLFFETYKLHK